MTILGMEAQQYLNEIIDHYGINSQLRKSAEEIDELYDAINHDCKFTDPVKYREDVLDELADCTVMCAQLAFIVERLRSSHNFGYPELEKRISFKIERTLGRIEDEREEEMESY